MKKIEEFYAKLPFLLPKRQRYGTLEGTKNDSHRSVNDMKIKTKTLSFDKVQALPKPIHKKPKKRGFFFSTLIRVLSFFDMLGTGFSYTTHRMEEAGEGPFLILMNHSSFIDLEIASVIRYPAPHCIVCTSDGFVGKEWLMRQIGCIPTRKFVTDFSLLSDIRYALKELKTDVLMYPEASYSFDGRSTPLPRHLGILLKRLNVPVLYIQTYGAFSRDPLYNGLQKRKVKVSAAISCLLTKEEIAEKSVEEMDDILDSAFSFDNFTWQKENGIEINEPFRADGLHRILYRCPHCESEGMTEGKGTTLTCHSCGAVYELDTLGQLKSTNQDTAFSHIPDWYQWEREQVRKELESGQYRLDTEVDIGIMTDYKAIYKVGSGRLVHDANGFRLTGCDGKLNYEQKPQASYGLYSDYYWYEIGDVICIGDGKLLYYCFPKGGESVAKARLAAEELYKLTKQTVR